MEDVASQDIEAINRANGRQHWVMEALTGLCQRGELKCKPIQHVRRDAGTGDVVLQWRDYLIEAEPFLEWLAIQDLEPSRFIVAWCNANGVNPDKTENHEETEMRQSPTVAASDSQPQSSKRWTSEFLEEVRAYREQHGTKSAAEKYGVSESLIRRKLPSDKPRQQGYSAFTHRAK
jgi:hypothetical protein